MPTLLAKASGEVTLQLKREFPTKTLPIFMSRARALLALAAVLIPLPWTKNSPGCSVLHGYSSATTESTSEDAAPAAEEPEAEEEEEEEGGFGGLGDLFG